MLVKRSKKSNSKQRDDRGSLVLMWITITLCFTFGFIFANYSVWRLLNFVIAGVGLLIILTGFVIRWMAIIQLKNAFTVDVAIGNEQNLKTDGLYKIIRHPSYLGLWLILVGFSVCMNSIISILIIVIPMFIVLLYRISVEEKVLVEAFGEKYMVYRTNTKMIIPFVI